MTALVALRSSAPAAPSHSYVAIALVRPGTVSSAIAVASVMLVFRAIRALVRSVWPGSPALESKCSQFGFARGAVTCHYHGEP